VAHLAQHLDPRAAVRPGRLVGFHEDAKSVNQRGLTIGILVKPARMERFATFLF
jgi:hypothetical protein